MRLIEWPLAAFAGYEYTYRPPAESIELPDEIVKPESLLLCCVGLYRLIPAGVISDAIDYREMRDKHKEAKVTIPPASLYFSQGEDVSTDVANVLLQELAK